MHTLPGDMYAVEPHSVVPSVRASAMVSLKHGWYHTTSTSGPVGPI